MQVRCSYLRSYPARFVSFLLSLSGRYLVIAPYLGSHTAPTRRVTRMPAPPRPMPNLTRRPRTTVAGGTQRACALLAPGSLASSPTAQQPTEFGAPNREDANAAAPKPAPSAL